MSLPVTVGQTRTLRLRADANLREIVRPPNGYNGAGEFVVPTREAVFVGQEIKIEVSLGALADEVAVDGVVTDVVMRGDGAAPLVTIYVVQADLPRMRYLLDVLEGVRSPTARRHRRIPIELDVRWWWGLRAFTHRASGLSCGGTFIAAEDAPRAGFRTEVEIRLDSKTAPLRMPASVVWLGETTRGRGFGVQFHVPDATSAERLRNVVRDFERETTKEVVTLTRR
jgi:Tfp pilus assembly protein PilZ